MNNQLCYVDIHYVIISSSADCGIYDLKINADLAQTIGLDRESIIKTTRSKLGVKIGELSLEIKYEFITKYRAYQSNMISNFLIN